METARRLYRRLLAVDDDSAAARMGLGDVAFQEGNAIAAARWYKSAVKRSEEPEERHSALLAHGRASLAAGQFGAARKSFTELAKARKGASATNLAWARNGVGLTLLLEGDLPGAVAELEEAVALAPEEERLQANLDSARVALGELPPAAGPSAGDGPPLDAPAAEAGATEPPQSQDLALAFDRPTAPALNPGPPDLDSGGLDSGDGGLAERPDPVVQPQPGIPASVEGEGDAPVETVSQPDQPGDAETRSEPLPERPDNALGASMAASPDEANEAAEPADAGQADASPTAEENADEGEAADGPSQPEEGLAGADAGSTESTDPIDGREGLDAGSAAPEALSFVAPPPLLEVPPDAADELEQGPQPEPSVAASPRSPGERIVVVAEDSGAFLQFGAFAEPANVAAAVARLRALTDHAVAVSDMPSVDGSSYQRVRVGPLLLRETLLGLVGVLERAGYEVANPPPPAAGSGPFTGPANQPLQTMLVEENAELFLQVGAYRKRATAQALAAELRHLTEREVGVAETGSAGDSFLYRVRIGPLQPDDDLIASLEPPREE